MSAQTFIPEAEVRELCHPLKQYAAMTRHLQRKGLHVIHRADGFPMVLRSSVEAQRDKPQNGKTAGPVWGVHA